MRNLQLGEIGISEHMATNVIEADICRIGEFEAYRNHGMVERFHPHELNATVASANVNWISECHGAKLERLKDDDEDEPHGRHERYGVRSTEYGVPAYKR